METTFFNAYKMFNAEYFALTVESSKFHDYRETQVGKLIPEKKENTTIRLPL